MCYKRYPNLDYDWTVRQHLRGVKLVKPEHLMNSTQTVGSLFQLPINVIFLNRKSVTVSINESNALTLGCLSIKDILGKTINDVYKEAAAHFSVQHDLDVMSTAQTIIREEFCERKDGVVFQSITAKLPWYNENNEIVGAVGYSIPLGLQQNNLEAALSTLFKLGIFSIAEKSSNIFKAGRTIDGVYLTPREAECAYHLTRGKTSKIIAKILGLSPRTVECYLNNIKIKLGVDSKPALIDKVFNWIA